MDFFVQPKAKLKYVAYIRKSSESEDQQMLSIDAQRRELEKMIERDKLTVVDFFSEKRSAYYTGRPEFNKMLELLKEGEANAILTYHVTRIARNSEDGGKVVYMMDTENIREIKTLEKTYINTSDDKFNLNIYFAMSKKSSDDTSQFVKRDIISKIKKGEMPNTASLGYLNMDKFGRIAGKKFVLEKQEAIEATAKSENRKILRVEQDPFNANKVLQAFKEFHTGFYSLEAMRDVTFNLGLTGVRSDIRLSTAQVVRLLTNPQYYGAIRMRGQIFEPEDLPEETRHIPIVSRVLFYEVQELIKERSRPHGSKHDYPYLGLFKCGECGCSITAETHKGYIYYRCTKKKTKCNQRYIRQDKLEEQMLSLVENYVIPKEFVKWGLKILSKEATKNTKSREMVLKEHLARVTNIDAQLTKLFDEWSSFKNSNKDFVSDEEYLEKKNKLKKDKNDLLYAIEKISKYSDSWLELSEEFLQFAQQMDKIWVNGEQKTRHFIFQLIFGSNSVLEDRKLSSTNEMPFLQTPKNGDLEKWRDGRGSNPQPFA